MLELYIPGKQQPIVEVEMTEDFEDNQVYLREYLEIAWGGNGYLPPTMRSAAQKTSEKLPYMLSNDTVGMLCNLTSIVLGGGVPLSSLWDKGGALEKALRKPGSQMSPELCKEAIYNYDKSYQNKKMKGTSDDLLWQTLIKDGKQVMQQKTDGTFNMKTYVERLESEFESKPQESKESRIRYKDLPGNARAASLCFTRWILYITSPNVQKLDRELEDQEDAKKKAK